ncbi:hypothetical protein L665_04790 [Ralstonia solanacearum SD54]|nr:hypothetical protein F504_3786 [Ralstonia pseudosolanacearum FQY_4]ESS51683.1 hypothetical protein L665_04790 [Ralstonia solanacearum SD54]
MRESICILKDNIGDFAGSRLSSEHAYYQNHPNKPKHRVLGPHR